MAALIWDSNKQAFEESELPLTYNPAIDAWQDTEGYEHNSELDAWEKVWPRKLYLYNQGDECADITGGWEYKQKIPFANAMRHGFETANQIPFCGHSAINVVYSASRATGQHISFYVNMGERGFMVFGGNDSTQGQGLTIQLPCTDIDAGYLFVCLASNAFPGYGAVFAGEKQGEHLKIYTSYAGDVVTLYIHEIYLT